MSERKTTQQLIEELALKFGDRYDLSKVISLGAHVKIEMHCYDHGTWFPTPADLKKTKIGCAGCASEDRLKKSLKIGQDNLIPDCRAVHGDSYGYDKAIWLGAGEKFEITCFVHGSFWQTKGNHVGKGSICPECSKILKSQKMLDKSRDNYYINADKVHDGKFTYDGDDYGGLGRSIGLTCPIHGWFRVNAGNHFHDDTGCPQCSASGTSKEENEIVDFIKSIYDGEIISRTRKIIAPKEIDIYIPEFNLGIEYHGLYYHSERYQPDRNCHYDKFKGCEEQGIRLLSIFGDEWMNKPQIIKNIIRNKLQKTENKIYARKCKIVEVETNIANKFYETNHIQGRSTRFKRTLGLYFKDKLIACMTLGSHPRNNSLTLSRYCTHLNYNVLGGASKLWKALSKDLEEPIISWSDNRYGTGELYKILGFQLDEKLKPQYSYVDGKRRIPKQNMQKKKIGCPPEVTERDFCISKGLYRIWDCGKKRWVWNPNDG